MKQKRISFFAWGVALLLGMAACSNEDGNDGVNGLNGENGENGTSCEVKSMEDGSGYKVICGDEEVGTLLNGKAGESCTASETIDGIKITCGDTETVIRDGDAGVNCYAKNVVDEENGRKGISMYCADTLVGTVWNGLDGDQGDAGVNCVSSDNQDGSVEITCGDDNSVTIYKAMCGDDAYDPETKFCVLGKLYDKCGGKTYAVNKETCNNGVVVELCSEYKTIGENDIKWVKDRPVEDGEFCWNGIIMSKCGGKEFGSNSYCGKTMDGLKDSIHNYCTNASELENIYNIIGMGSVVTGLEEDGDASGSSEQSFFGDLIGKPLTHYNEEKLAEFFMALGDIQSGALVCGAEPLKRRCGSTVYDTKDQFCDIRDKQVYKFVTIVSENPAYNKKWMAENLNYQTANSWCGGESDATEGDCATYGRLYTWAAAMGKSENECGSGHDCNSGTIKVQGVCPEGWHVPKHSEWNDLFTAVGGLSTAGQKLKAATLWNAEDGIDNKDDYGFAALPAGLYYKGNFSGVGSFAFFWSASQRENNDEDAFSMGLNYDTDYASLEYASKNQGYSVRCLQD